VWQIILFYFATPGLIVGINLVGVGTFGWIEAVGGMLKITLVVGVTIVLYVMAATGKFNPCIVNAGPLISPLEHHWSGTSRKLNSKIEHACSTDFTSNPGWLHL
jgi:amino acid transporter